MIAIKPRIFYSDGVGGNSSGANGSGISGTPTKKWKGGALKNPTVQQDNYTGAELDALERYTSSSDINSRLAEKGYEGLSMEDKEYVDHLDSAISKSGWNQTQLDTGLMRGAGGYAIGIPEDYRFESAHDLSAYINENIAGTGIAVNLGLTSMTSDPDVARSFSGSETNPIIMHYDRVEAGTKGAYVSGGNGKKPISTYDEYECETIGQRNIATAVNGSWVGHDGNVHVSVSIRPATEAEIADAIMFK